MKKIVVAAALLLLAAGCSKQQPSIQDSVYNKGTIQLAGSSVNLDVARTDSEKSAGLSNRESISDSEGMLFLMDVSVPSFWMKDMRFPIDIVWIRNGKVVDISKNCPAPSDKFEELTIYQPDQEIDMVLEVKSGWSERHNLKVGDSVKVELK